MNFLLLNIITTSLDYHRTRPLRRVYALLVAGVADLFYRVGVKNTAASLKVIAFYPAGSVGREGSSIVLSGDLISSASLKEQQQRQKLRALVEQGDAGAQNNLGVLLERGLMGFHQDDTKAVPWYRRAANQGNAQAQFNLGRMYGNGQGVPQDYVEVHMWYNLAAAQQTGEDRDLAVKNRDVVAGRMTAEQLAEAQRRAREWTPMPEP